VVHPADLQDRDGGVLVLSTLFGMFPFLLKLFADGGYQAPQFRMAVAKLLPQLSVEIVKRSNRAEGFTVLPRRWVAERTLAWLGLAGPLPSIEQESREPAPNRGGLHPPGINPPHGEKAL